MTHSNPYVQTLLEKGYSVAETQTPAKESTYPRTVGGKVFNSKEEYEEALANFLNGF